ncbi:MAG: hypothetical protein IPG93_24500 [Burkholderiales bacterium]|nr:hypothetical protein [Burkholderiales bacterium]
MATTATASGPASTASPPSSIESGGGPGQAHRTGGTVEPVHARTRTADHGVEQVASAVGQERFEVRDPTAETTYRANHLGEAQSRAAALGATRIVAIDAQGRRTPIRQVDGQWQRGEPMPPRPDRPAAAYAQERDDESAPARPAGALAVEPRPQSPTGSRTELQAERAALAARLDAALRERYLIRRAPIVMGDVTIGRTEYRYRGDSTRVAFTESTFKLATQSDQPSVARSMVDVAQARGWKGVRIAGSEDFRRMVWLEASVRGLKTQGYEPSPAEIDLMLREREARQVNRIEPERGQPDRPNVDRTTPSPTTPGRVRPDEATTSASTPAAQKASGRGSGGRKAVLAAIEAVLVSRGVAQVRREAVLAAATEQLAARAQRGEPAPRIKVYDAAAPSRRPTPVHPAPEHARSRERAAPAR